MEISGFSKFIVRGPGARAFLDRVLACRIPEPGRMTLAPMLKEDGKLQGDLSIAALGGGGVLPRRLRHGRALLRALVRPLPAAATAR